MKVYIVVYFSMDTAHQVYKIVEEDHDKAMLAAYKKYNTDWRNEADPANKDIKEDFYKNAEVVATVDAPLNTVDIVYHQLVYIMPEINPEEL